MRGERSWPTILYSVLVFPHAVLYIEGLFWKIRADVWNEKFKRCLIKIPSLEVKLPLSFLVVCVNQTDRNIWSVEWLSPLSPFQVTSFLAHSTIWEKKNKTWTVWCSKRSWKNPVSYKLPYLLPITWAEGIMYWVEYE